MYHIVKSKSKTKPFNLVSVAANGEPLSSHPLATKQACFKNVKAQVKEVVSVAGHWVYVQDDTLRTPVAYAVYPEGKRRAPGMEKPKYVPGKNKRK